MPDQGRNGGVLNERVLVLNKSWIAVHVANVKRAVSLVFLDLARIVNTENFETHDFASWVHESANNGHDPNARYIRTPTLALQVPEVIRLTNYNRVPRQDVHLSRRSIYERDDGCCQYCGVRVPFSEYTLEHVVPRSRGGYTRWENAVVSCPRCNARKGNRTPAEADMTLRRHPVKPRCATPLGVRLGQGLRASWKKFLGEAYWDRDTA